MRASFLLFFTSLAPLSVVFTLCHEHVKICSAKTHKLLMGAVFSQALIINEGNFIAELGLSKAVRYITEVFPL